MKEAACLCVWPWHRETNCPSPAVYRGTMWRKPIYTQNKVKLAHGNIASPHLQRSGTGWICKSLLVDNTHPSTSFESTVSKWGSFFSYSYAVLIPFLFLSGEEQKAQIREQRRRDCWKMEQKTLWHSSQGHAHSKVVESHWVHWLVRWRFSKVIQLTTASFQPTPGNGCFQFNIYIWESLDLVHQERGKGNKWMWLLSLSFSIQFSRVVSNNPNRTYVEVPRTPLTQKANALSQTGRTHNFKYIIDRWKEMPRCFEEEFLSNSCLQYTRDSRKEGCVRCSSSNPKSS